MTEYKFFYGGVREHQIINKLAEETFGVLSDPQQLQILPERDIIWSEQFPQSLLIAEHQKQVIGFSFNIPTSQETMNAFLNKTITEEELAQQVIEQKLDMKDTRCIYLCSCVIIAEHQRKGIATKMYEIFLENTPKDAVLYSWPWSEKGKKFLEHLERLTGRTIHKR